MITEDMKQVLEFYNQGLSLYKQRDFKKAKDFFEKSLKVNPNDGPSRLYVERCDAFLKTPPPEDWDGVYIMTTK